MIRLARWLPSFMLVVYTCATMAANAQAVGPPRSRHEFAKAIGKLKEGMPEAEVLIRAANLLQPLGKEKAWPANPT